MHEKEEGYVAVNDLRERITKTRAECSIRGGEKFRLIGFFSPKKKEDHVVQRELTGEDAKEKKKPLHRYYFQSPVLNKGPAAHQPGGIA